VEEVTKHRQRRRGSILAGQARGSVLGRVAPTGASRRKSITGGPSSLSAADATAGAAAGAGGGARKSSVVAGYNRASRRMSLGGGRMH
jgi:hypothetical protein